MLIAPPSRTVALFVAVAGFAFPLQRANADPLDGGHLKLWVQTDGRMATAAGTLVDLGADQRLRPILRINLPLNPIRCNSSCFSYPYVCPSAAAQEIVCQLDQFVVNGTPTREIAIMLAGLGDGGRPDVPEFNRHAPAIAKPAVPGVAETDWTTNTSAGYLTPWFKYGPAECSLWMRDFADAYMAEVQSRYSPIADTCAFRPRRLIFDLEVPPAPFYPPSFVSGVRASIVSDPERSDPTDSGWLVKGFRSAPIDPPNSDSGRTLLDLHTNFTPPCDNCTSPWEQDRVWLAMVNRQAQVAAMDRAVRLQFGGSHPAMLDSFFPQAGCLPTFYTNFLFSQTNGLKEEDRPPYNFNGQALRKVAYRDLTYYETYNNFADFSAPVSYGFWRPNRPLPAGMTPSDFVLQAAREALESIMFSLGNPYIPAAFGEGQPPRVTPWISAINQYFSNGDHHRKLLALMRAKDCHEYNVFINTDPATHDRVMGNWSKFRHILDQVYGFDLESATVSVGTLDANDVINANNLKLGDFNVVHLNAGWDPGIPSTNNEDQSVGEAIAQVETVFRTFDAPDRGTMPVNAPNFDRDSIRKSAMLRLNVEVTAKYPTLPPGGNVFVPQTPFTIDAQFYNWTTNGWVNAPLTLVCNPASRPAFGSRYVMTGMASNVNRRLVGTDDLISRPLKYPTLAAESPGFRD